MGQELNTNGRLTRRKFLIAGAVGAAGVAGVSLGLRVLRPQEPPSATTPALAGAPAPPAYDDWRDVYRERWRWDKVVRSSHFVNC
jgi:hypothetical protein